VQQPHPPLMQPFAFSESTIRWCAREGIMPVLSPVDVSLRLHLYHAYQDEARRAGRDLAFGDGLGLLRDVIVAPTDEEAQALHAQSGAFAGGAWFRPFGFDRGLAAPGESGPLTVPDLRERGLLLVGSPETVTRQLDLLFKQAPIDYLVAWQYISLIPNDALKRSIELFATKVLPRFQ
jgi:alkanesulfonate monooxygenase SsuD/methylene tetrahydromethanopterin reductase-like flavin-dependent oxidoreductase (luciferase family)